MSGEISFDKVGDNLYGLFEVANIAVYDEGFVSVGYSSGRGSISDVNIKEIVYPDGSVGNPILYEYQMVPKCSSGYEPLLLSTSSMMICQECQVTSLRMSQLYIHIIPIISLFCLHLVYRARLVTTNFTSEMGYACHAQKELTVAHKV